MTHKKALRILLVEDDVWLAELEVRALEKAGYDVLHVPHAPAAIVAVDQFNPDVIILDVLLTGTTAFALLHELQSYEDTADVPIILCTNMAESIHMDEVQSYGVKRIVNKATMVPDDLVAAVRSVSE